MKISRRKAMQFMAGAATAMLPLRGKGQSGGNLPARKIASGPFQPTWDSLKQYRAPDWFRDAKFGLWAHWTAQCVPEQGDWYARRMYIQGHPQNAYHVAHYGHPSKFGWMEIDNLWKAERWDPHALMQLYVNAGAKYFVALANHHDNFDTYDSKYHEWNSTRIGPMKDIVGTWAKVAREHGLRFGVTNHSSHAWHWLQTAYGYDSEGPMAGIRYDAYRLTKDDGKGKWWEGFDPQQLYTGRNLVIPDGMPSAKAASDWQAKNTQWSEIAPPMDPEFTDRWFLRTQDLVDKYHPDLLYFDDSELPLQQTGLDIAAHYYNSSMARNHGRQEVVLNAKAMKPEHMGTVVLDIERGRSQGILEYPWQTDTCIGNWHYDRSIFENHKYKTATTVIHMLADIVSKNGNLLLNIPVRGDGTIDEDEHEFLTQIATWIPANGEAIFGTRPFEVYGEGPPDVVSTGNFNESKSRPYTSEDIRFTAKGDKVYAIALGWPDNGKLTIKTLAQGSQVYPGKIGKVELLGQYGKLHFTRDQAGLTVTLPALKPNDYAYTLKITPRT
jgi:alpha-L-fucosidase